MERNRIRYFIVAVALLIFGYVTRTFDDVFWKNTSYAIITAGVYFIIAIILKKAAAWVVLIIDLFICCGLQTLRLFSVEWYNTFYDSDIGRFIIGGPFSVTIFTYIFIGSVIGALLEIGLRQFNQVGMG